MTFFPEFSFLIYFLGLWFGPEFSPTALMPSLLVGLQTGASARWWPLAAVASLASLSSVLPPGRTFPRLASQRRKQEMITRSADWQTATASAKNGLLFLTGNPSGQILMTNLPTDWIWNGVMHVLVNLVSVACYLSPGLAMSRLITANTVRVDHTHRTHTLR